MKILVSSIIDLKNSTHNSRLHQFLKFLSRNHEISVISINDHWKARWDKPADNYNLSFRELFEKIDLFYLTDRRVSPFVQEALSVLTVENTLDKVGVSDYDVHFNYNGMVSGYAVGRITHSYGIPSVYDLADDLPEMIRTSPQIPPIIRPTGGWVGKAIMSKCIRSSESVTITTESLCQAYGIPQNKWDLLPNGVDTELFSPRPCGHIKKRYGLEDSFVVGYVGVLREWLDLGSLFNAIEDLSSKINIKLLIVGGGVGYEKAVEMARNYNVLAHTVFTGTIPYSQVPEYLSCMDVGVIPFKQDNVSNNSLPLKLFEYMACGVPVISTYIDAIQKKFDRTVRFVSSSEEYREEILYMHQNPDLRRKIGLDGRRIVASEYQWTVIAEKLEHILVKAGC